MSGHTPAPWEFIPSPEYGFSTLWNPETREEVLVTGGINDGDEPITWMGEELSEANKRMIEAAPDILAALEAATEAYAYHYGEDCPLTIQCREAIAKAKVEI